MPRYKDNDSVSLSVKISAELDGKVKKLAQETKRSQSNMYVYLMSVGVTSESPDADDSRADVADEYINTSLSTSFADTIKRVEELAEECFNGTFSRAVRYSIRNGLVEEYGAEYGGV